MEALPVRCSCSTPSQEPLACASTLAPHSRCYRPLGVAADLCLRSCQRHCLAPAPGVTETDSKIILQYMYTNRVNKCILVEKSVVFIFSITFNIVIIMNVAILSNVQNHIVDVKTAGER